MENNIFFMNHSLGSETTTQQAVDKVVQEVVDEGPVLITKQGWENFGAVNYKKDTAARELINNVLVKSTFGRKVKVQFLIDSVTKRLYVTDDFFGFVWETMRRTMDLGESVVTPAILSEHGSGMKTAVSWFGVLEYIRSTQDGERFYDLVRDKSKDHAHHKTLKTSEKIKRFDVSNLEWVEQKGVGAQICIKLSDNQVPKITSWWTNLKRDLEKSYFDHVGVNGVLDVELIWLEDGVRRWSDHIQKNNILLASPRLGEKQGWIGSKKKLGPNDWCIDEMYRCPDTDIKVELKIGYVPHPKNVADYFMESQDPVYNPANYEESPFKYASDTMGLSYSKEWIPISFGNYKATSRSSDMFGLINIVSGITTVKTKDNIKRTADVEIFEANLSKFLKKRGMRVRSQATYMSISEAQMEEKLLEKLRRSSKLRKYLGYTINDFDNQWALHSGQPDIVNLDHKKVIGIIEIKKEGNERLYKGLLQGLVYATESEVKNILLVAQDDVLPSEVQIKVDMFIKHGWDIRYEQYQKLMEL